MKMIKNIPGHHHSDNKTFKIYLGLLIVNILTLLIWLIFNHRVIDIVTVVSYIFYVLFLFFQSLGKWQGNIFNVICYILYVYICIHFFLLGELIMSITAIIIYISMIFIWKNNQKKNIVKKRVIINKVKPKEVIFVNVIGIILFLILYFILKKLNSNQYLVNALLMATQITMYYFSYKVSKVIFVYNFINLILLNILWITIFIEGDSVGLIHIINNVFVLAWLIISIINWNKMEKQQKENKNLISLESI